MPEDRTVTWRLKEYSLTRNRGGWRLRSRAKGNDFDWDFPRCTLAMAKADALARFAGEAPTPMRDAATLEDAIKVYLQIPRRVSDKSAYNNITRLRSCAKYALKKKLDRILVSAIGPRFWAAAMAGRQGGTLDLSRRRPENVAINTMVRTACSIFIPSLRHHYKDHGITIPADACSVQWLPVMKQPKPKAKVNELEIAWSKLKDVAPALYFTIGLARFAGLRLQEVAACQRHWLIEEGGAVYVEMMDRPAESWAGKTGEMYRAMVIHPGFAQDLLAMPKGFIVTTPERISKKPMTRDFWFRKTAQTWLKPFTGRALKPLHRLRGLYADDMLRLGRDAMAARIAGLNYARDALGHTSAETTKGYLSTP